MEKKHLVRSLKNRPQLKFRLVDSTWDGSLLIANQWFMDVGLAQSLVPRTS
jgi:hypothetical protein